MREAVNEKLRIKNVFFKTRNVLLLGITDNSKRSKHTAFIICEGVSMSVDQYNVPYLWDPFLSIPNEKEYRGVLEGDILSMYFPFECMGLQEAGKDLAEYINENMSDYQKIVIIGHSKAGVCIANMAKMLKRKVILIFVSAPFEGTIMTDAKNIKERLIKPEYAIYKKYYNEHPVDLDIKTDSEFLRKVADFSGVNDHTCINIISECISLYSIVDVGCKYLGMRIGYEHSDGIVSVNSQESLSRKYLSIKNIYIDASHANSLKRMLSARRKKYIIE